MKSQLLLTLGIFVLAVPAISLADQGKTYRRHRGLVVFQETEFGSFTTEDDLYKMVSKARRNKTLQRNEKGRWNMSFIAFFKKKPSGTKVNLVWYELGRKREQITFTEYSIAPDALTLQSKAELSPTHGFKVGKRYEMRITRLINGRERVYARNRVVLK